MIAFALHQKYIGAGGEGFLPMLDNGNANADAAFPTLVAKLLPAGMKGLVVCGILAALMSSLASLFNSSAMLFTIDFYKRFKPETPEKKLVGIGQVATVVIVILGILWIPMPNLEVGAGAWILAGGTHHSCFSYDLTAEYWEDYAEIAGIEMVHINKDTTTSCFKKELRMNEVYYMLNKALC